MDKITEWLDGEDAEWVNIYRTYSKQRRMFDYLDRNDMEEVCFRSLNTIGWTNNMKRPRAGDTIMTNQK